MTLDDIKNKLKGEIGDNTKNALVQIEKELRKDSYLYSEFVVYENKYNSLSTKSNKGIISDESSRIEESQIVNSIIELIDKMKENDLEIFRESHPKPIKKSPQTENSKPSVKQTPPKTFSELFINILWGAKYKKVITVFLLLFSIVFLIWTNLPTSIQEKILNNVISNSTPVVNDDKNYSPADFEVINRRTIIDLRSWKKVPRKLRDSIRFSPVFYTQIHEIEKKNSNVDFFLKNHWTSGVALDIGCWTQEFDVKEIKGKYKPGETLYDKYEIKFDVKNYAQYDEFNVEYQAIYWNAFQNEKSESIGATIVHPTRKLTIELFFPLEIDENGLIFKHARKNQNDEVSRISQPTYEFDGRHLIWTISNPLTDYFYTINWDWDVSNFKNFK